jgi:Ca-activated chloride channel family protein
LNVQGAIRLQFGVQAFVVCGLALILSLCFCLAVSSGQEPSDIPNGGDRTVAPDVLSADTTLRVRSDLVLIPVTVTDGRGRAVSGLEKEHFTLFEDNEPQKITHFAAEDAPASIGILFDASDSMGPKLHKARESVNALLNNVNPNSEFFLVRFSTTAQIIVPMTSRPEEIRNSVEGLRVDGSTALLDGVRLGMAEMTRARYSRKVIIIISDGEDNSSHWTVSELKSAVREHDILIYAIGITDPVEPYVSSPQLLGEALLKEIAKQTGGRMFAVKRVQQLPDIAGKIGSLLRTQYVVGYVPNHSAMDGTYRKIQLKVTRPKGYPRLHAIWRQGYYAPKE